MPECWLLNPALSVAGRLQTVDEAPVKDVDAGTAKDMAAGTVKGVDVGMVKAGDMGKETHNLSRGCRDYKKYMGKNQSEYR